MTKLCYVNNSPKYVSKGNSFIVCALVSVCVCVYVFVHSPVLSTSTEYLVCIKHLQKKNQNRQRGVKWTGNDSYYHLGWWLEPNPAVGVNLFGVNLKPFPKTHAFMRTVACNSCIRPGCLIGCLKLHQTGQKVSRSACNIWWLWEWEICSCNKRLWNIMTAWTSCSRCKPDLRLNVHDVEQTQVSDWGSVRFYLEDCSEEHACLEGGPQDREG